MPDVPNDHEAEKSIVGCVVLQPAILDDLRLAPSDFFSKELGTLYAACIDLSIEQKPITGRTLADKAGADATFVFECEEGANPAEAPFWAERIVRARKRRQLLSAGNFAQKLAADADADPDEGMLRAEEMLASFSGQQQDQETVALTDAVGTVMERIDRYIADPDAIAGLSTGWAKFDRILDGLQKGTVASVYAKTGTYKSFFIQNIAWRLGRDGVPGAVFTTEMTQTQVTNRLLQLESGLNFRELRWHRELYAHRAHIAEAAEDLRLYPIWINDRSLLDVQYVRGYLSRLRRTHGIEWAFVDLANHVYSNRFKDNETKNEAFVVNQMKQSAKDLDIFIGYTAHTSKTDRRQLVEKTYLDPEDMKGSSSFSQDADACISLVLVVRNDLGTGYRPMTREERIAAQCTSEPMLVMASITKNRFGIQDDIIFKVDPQKGGLMTVEADR